MKTINSHIHIFPFEATPINFVPLLGRFITKNEKTLKTAAKVLHYANPFTDKDVLDKFSTYIQTMGMSQREILLKAINANKEGMMFNVLAMDLSCMCAGKVRMDYFDQLNELVELKKEFPQMLISVMVDPRSKHLDDLKWWMLYNSDSISGVKIYPLVGYTTNDERLYPFYEMCEKYDWTVTVHGSPKNAVYLRDGKEMRKTLPKDFPYYEKKRTKKNKARNYAHPYWTVQAAEAFPNVNFNIAHFAPYYRDYIISEIKEHNNIYTDISFTYNEAKEVEQLVDILKANPEILPFVLYGTDYYMIETQDIGNPFLHIEIILGVELYNQIAVINPNEFFKF